MVGQGSPIIWQNLDRLLAALPHRKGLSRLGCCTALVVASICCACCPAFAAEKTARLRLVWGGGSSTKTRWTGEISIEGGILTDLQPLGIEADAPVALRLNGNRVIVAPRENRGFDGCDLTVRADEQALVSILLHADKTPEPTRIEVPFAQLVTDEFRQALHEPGSSFLAHRAPGDKLRVLPSRAHYVFNPAEVWTLSLQPDLAGELATGPVELEVTLRRVGNEEILWQTSRHMTAEQLNDPSVDFEIASPDEENAYRVTVVARRPDGLVTRLVPRRWAKVLAKRDVEFVVIDPAARLPRLADRWEPVLAIDPANPSWWQRLPAWTRVPGLRERTPGAIGNVRPVVRPGPRGDFVELPGISKDAEPYWQSYTLPVREPGTMHLVEVAYPLGVAQHMTISIIEPDAAGRVMGVQQDAGFYTAGEISDQGGNLGLHRFVFWPRTRAPQLLLVNRGTTSSAQYGQIKLYRHALATDSEAARTGDQQPTGENSERIVAGYISQPAFASNFGAAEILDPDSGLSVQSWSTFLEGAQRLAQYARLNGQNTIFLVVAADGSALYPSQLLNPSLRYDNGLQAASGQDPTRKDVLEMLLRILDREGIRLIPTLQLATPLPRLEHERLRANAEESGISWIGQDGQGWLEQNDTDHGLAPHYNPLNSRVQSEVAAMISELAERYARHPSLKGVGIQVAGSGYGVLRGLAWGLDDTTVARFTNETGIRISASGPHRFGQRAAQLLGEHSTQWTNWRAQQLTELYAGLANSLVMRRADLQLFLTTESLFSGQTLPKLLRQSLAAPINLRQILLEHGLDLATLNATPGVTALSAIRQNASGKLQRQALDLRVNTASTQGELFTGGQHEAWLLYQDASSFRLPSFDERSPFGVGQTHLLLGGQALPAGDAQRRQLVASVARHDAECIVVGGPKLSLATHTEVRQTLHILRQLPAPETAERTLHHQPLVARIYRADQETTIALVNESPWPVKVQLPLDTPVQSEWRKLGAGSEASAGAVEGETGTLVPGAGPWHLEIKPYELQAWRFDTSKLRVGEPTTEQDELVRSALEHRIWEIEARTGNLNIERPYLQLQNPGFELRDSGQRIVGWQPRFGTAGAVCLESKPVHGGENALRLKSENALGVAVQSHLFPMPETGQLAVSVFLRRAHWDPGAQLRIVIEDGSGGHAYHKFAVLADEKSLDAQWKRYDFPVDDIPLNSADQMYIRFHLTGKAEVMIDDVELCDLRFNEAQRAAAAKRIYAAKNTLAQGHVVDCLQVVDAYWSRYLVEYVPPLELAPVTLAKQPRDPPVKVDEEDSKGFGERVRQWVPRIWR